MINYTQLKTGNDPETRLAIVDCWQNYSLVKASLICFRLHVLNRTQDQEGCEKKAMGMGRTGEASRPDSSAAIEHSIEASLWLPQRDASTEDPQREASEEAIQYSEEASLRGSPLRKPLRKPSEEASGALRGSLPLRKPLAPSEEASL
jgi:hypothetical protein